MNIASSHEQYLRIENDQSSIEEQINYDKNLPYCSLDNYYYSKLLKGTVPEVIRFLSFFIVFKNCYGIGNNV